MYSIFDAFKDARIVLHEMKKLYFLFSTLFVMPSIIMGCSSNRLSMGKVRSYHRAKPVAHALTERECLMRAMYFESNRSSHEGMIAVGTVVMNRVNSSAYPRTICGVVGQRKQFAPGVLTRPMTERASVARVREAADAVLRGKRDKRVKNAMFFHTVGYSFPYRNMYYVRIAGGNAFYEKRSRDGSLQVPANNRPYNVAFAFAQERSSQIFRFMSAGLDSRNQMRKGVQIASVMKEQERKYQTDDELFVTRLNKIPIPTRAPDYTSTIPVFERVAEYSVPLPDKLNMVASVLEEQRRRR